MTRPGKRNIGPPNSAAQWPSFLWSFLWYENPFLAASSGDLGVGSDGRFYKEAFSENGAPKKTSGN
jgi:hypothetical protein